MGKNKLDIEALPYRPNVGVMLVNGAGLIWAGRRLDSTAEAWQMPQGGIDKGEAPRAAALRELCEETGLSADLVTIEAETPEWLRYDLPQELVGKLWKGRWRGQEQKWFLMRFHGSDAQVNIDTPHPEFSEWAWMPAGKLLDLIVPFKRQVYTRVFDCFAGQLAAAGAQAEGGQ